MRNGQNSPVAASWVRNRVLGGGPESGQILPDAASSDLTHLPVIPCPGTTNPRFCRRSFQHVATIPCFEHGARRECGAPLPDPKARRSQFFFGEYSISSTGPGEGENYHPSMVLTGCNLKANRHVHVPITAGKVRICANRKEAADGENKLGTLARPEKSDQIRSDREAPRPPCVTLRIRAAPPQPAEGCQHAL